MPRSVMYLRRLSALREPSAEIARRVVDGGTADERGKQSRAVEKFAHDHVHHACFALHLAFDLLCVRTSLGNCDRKFAACPFIQPPGQLLLSVFPSLIRRCPPLSQVCITVDLRMRGTQAHRHQASLADVWWSLRYESPTRRISYSPLRLARSSSAAQLLRTGPPWAAFLLGSLPAYVV